MDAIVVDRLMVRRGHKTVLHGLGCTIPRGPDHRAARADRRGKTTLMRADGRRADGRRGARSPCSAAGRLAGPAPPDRLSHPGAERLRRPDRRRRTSGYFAAARTGAGRGDADGRSRTSGLADAAGQLVRQPVRRPARPGVAGLRAGRRPGGAGARRADGRVRTRCCATSCGSVPRAAPTAGATVLVSSHVMDEANRCDRLLLIREGRLIADDTPDAVRPTRRHGPTSTPAFLTTDHRRAARAHEPNVMNPYPRSWPPPPAAILQPAAPRPPHGRAARRRPGGAADPAVLHVRRTRPGVFDAIGLIMLGIFPFVIMFLITSIAMLRERTTGTLERLLTTPMGKLDLLFGYGIAFGMAAAVQAAVAAASAYWLFGMQTAGRAGLVDGDRGAHRGARRRARPALLARSPAPSSRPCSSCRSW